MVRHICMFKLIEENKAENLAQFVQRAKALDDIEQLLSCQVVCNGADMPQSNYDVALICDFNTKEDLDAYQVHPIHKAFGAFVGQVRKDRACIDFVAEE